MTLTAASSVPEVAVAAGAQLRRHRIRAVLTGGACVSVYTEGACVSEDADFVIRGKVWQKALDDALAKLGFIRRGDRSVHAGVTFYLEFPPGPLAIGSDLATRPADAEIAGVVALAVSPTDSCRDRLAAFCHWRDRQSLQLAVAVSGTRQSISKLSASGAAPRAVSIISTSFCARFGEPASPVNGTA